MCVCTNSLPSVKYGYLTVDMPCFIFQFNVYSYCYRIQMGIEVNKRHAPVWQAWGVLESRYNCGFIDDGNGDGISSKTTSGINPQDEASEAYCKILT